MSVHEQRKFLPLVGAFLAGELLPGTESCFFMAGGVEDNLLNGRTGWTGVLREPMDLGRVWLFERVAFAGRLAATVSFLPEAVNKSSFLKSMRCNNSF